MVATALSSCDAASSEQLNSWRFMDKVWYINHYYCETCNIHWDDEWDCMCNDRCPKCNKEIQPYASDDITTSENN